MFDILEIGLTDRQGKVVHISAPLLPVGEAEVIGGVSLECAQKEGPEFSLFLIGGEKGVICGEAKEE
jgi:hypothetical protein